MFLTYFSATKLISNKTPFILLAYLTCCILAYPSSPSQYRKANSNSNDNYNNENNYYSYNVAPYMETETSDDLGEYKPQPNFNQWDKAREPLNYDDLLEDYYNQPNAFSELETFSNMYDPSPVWGQIVNGKPESELEELKAEERRREEQQRELQQEQKPLTMEEQFNRYFYETGSQQKRDSSMPKHFKQNQMMHHESDFIASASSVAPMVASTSKAKVAITTTPTKAPASASTETRKMQSGQKEVPLLRPPNKPKAMENEEDDVPVIQVVQRSSAPEKPSAYDTLRKYISLEDALKKEAEKRKVSVKSRLQKRAPAAQAKKQIISDLDSLSGQLHNLKKSA